jgi:hypothetical protein
MTDLAGIDPERRPRSGRAVLGIDGVWAADHAEVADALRRGCFTWPWRMRVERVTGPITFVTGTRTTELDRGSIPLFVGTVLDISAKADVGTAFYYTVVGHPGVEGFP